MGGKKKAAPKKGKSPADAEVDDSVQKFHNLYKKKTQELGIDYCDIIKAKVELWQEDNAEFITKFHIWKELGEAGTKAIFESLRTIPGNPYQHCISIRLWKTFCEDEGTRQVCLFLEHEKVNSVLFLELLDNRITPLGCEFISRALHPKMNPTIEILKLDHNEFGYQGVINLAHGLAINPTLRMLSLTYCGIDQRGARALFEILIYSRSKLEDVNLSGNMLRDEGVITVLNGVSIAKSLKKISLADNQFSESEAVLNAMDCCMVKNKNLGKYDFKYNNIADTGYSRLIEVLSKEECSHVFDVELPERVDDKEIFTNFRAALAANKPSKKKKGKGGKKKKKK